MEELKPLVQQLARDVAEVKQDQKELIKQGAIHNVLLQTHEARSLSLQQEQRLQAAKMEPIQRHVEIVNGLGKLALALLTGVLVYTITHKLG